MRGAARHCRSLLAALPLLFWACGSDERPPREVGPVAGASTPAARATLAVRARAVSPEAEKGRDLYLGYCISCHSVDGRGLQAVGIDLTTSRFVALQSDDALAGFLESGRLPGAPDNRTGRAMPGLAELPGIGPSELRALVAHLREINSAS